MTDHSRQDDAEPGARRALWFSPDKTRQFLIPEAIEIAAGPLELRTASGRRRFVDPTLIASYAVTPAEGQAWAKAQLAEVVRRLGTGLGRSWSRGATTGSADADAANAGEGRAQASPTPGLDLLADITGTPRDQLDGDHRAVGEALRGYLRDAVGTTLDGLSDDPERKAASRRRMREWGETLRAHGIAARDVEEDPGGDGSADGGKETPGTRSGGPE